MAYEILLKILDSTDYVDTLAVSHAFELTDEYLERANKNTERPAVIADNWISVEDRLPKDFSEVLGCACDDNVLVAYWSGEEWYSPSDALLNITHWQALPSPPKGASE